MNERTPSDAWLLLREEDTEGDRLDDLDFVVGGSSTVVGTDRDGGGSGSESWRCEVEEPVKLSAMAELRSNMAFVGRGVMGVSPFLWDDICGCLHGDLPFRGALQQSEHLTSQAVLCDG